MELRFDDGWGRGGLLFDKVNELFNGTLAGGPSRIVPATEIVEDHDAYYFSLEMPGLKNDSIDLQVEEDTLIVTAERLSPERPKDARVHRSERQYGKIRRAFLLPNDAAHEGIKAAYKDGVLEVTVPKLPEAKPVKIEVDFNNN